MTKDEARIQALQIELDETKRKLADAELDIRLLRSVLAGATENHDALNDFAERWAQSRGTY